MKGPWISLLSIVMFGLGLLAELNLLRIFLRDWRSGRREEIENQFQSCSVTPARARQPVSRLAACLALPALFGSIARGQGPTATDQPGSPPAASNQPVSAEQTKTAAPDEPKSPFSVQLNLDFTNAYFYHGIVQEDSGLIVQPAAKLTVNVYERDDVRVDVFMATWNSFQGQATGAQTRGDFTEYWYESDLVGGFTFSAGQFSLSTQYVFLTSPSDAYETVQELDFTLTYDDSELLGKFALHPYALMGIETGADCSDGANSDPGTYLELGVAPGFSCDLGKTSVAISFPMSIGLSLHDYYQNAAGDDDTFGFVQVGAKASLPLPIADRYGKWTLNASIAGMYLGDHTSEYNGGDHQQLIGALGLQVSF